jgi:hypothetical protein
MWGKGLGVDREGVWSLARSGALGCSEEGGRRDHRSAAELAAEARKGDRRSFLRRVKGDTRGEYIPEEKVRVVLDGFLGEIVTSAVYPGEDISPRTSTPG